ncbi:hypothetical protein ACWE42_02705 [Sutcliffiella cohnii]|uniref:Uncharacterized protein n=1 Tax=Sutcliffiella cohnii TaxID=33932 RepID=A0A223KRF5_9BACI|nr:MULTISPECIES: hypothetical protein [Sutcliffiella]AST91903.1 hypothetical protein BC6307_11750 [Sutcliffiella cohnii]MED4015173.1 hypothetical protein [Sutcliffiella cohnii]WBL13134.1 hypothetical protein O1A01_14440 [Sutcliffiella sp. NC1]
MKNTKLRIMWIIPNVFCYVMFIGFSSFVIINADGLYEIARLSIWVLTMIFLFIVSIIGSYRIWSWIKQGKI